MTLRVLITRPQREAQVWAQRLLRQGLACEVLPLIEIAPAGDPQALHQARASANAWHAVMFVSANAAEHFFSGPVAQGMAPAPAAIEMTCRFWATGAGTRVALLEQGVPAERVDCPPENALQFDSEALWAAVKPQVQPGARVLLVRGADASGEPAGRDWLAQQLRDAGAVVQTLVAYQRRPPQWDKAQRAMAAQAADAGAIWLFSSSQAIANLCALMPAQRWDRALALATHPRIAQAARDAGFARVRITRPTVDDVILSIKSMDVQH